MYVTPEVKQRVTNKLKEVIALAEMHYGKEFHFPTVVYHKRGTTAGTANYRTWTIDLNPVLLMENIDQFIARTVPHEMAHLVCDKVYPEAHRPGYSFGRRAKREVHGPRWREVMAVMGIADSTRCHSYDTSTAAVKKASTRIHPWHCPCGKEFKLSPKMNQQLLTNPTARYHCKGRRLIAGAIGTPVAAPVIVKPVVQQPVFAQPAAQQRPAVQAPAGSSKLDICASIYQQSKSLGRAELIALFVSKAGCTPAGAATYYATMKKRFS